MDSAFQQLRPQQKNDGDEDDEDVSSAQSEP